MALRLRGGGAGSLQLGTGREDELVPIPGLAGPAKAGSSLPFCPAPPGPVPDSMAG